MQATIVKRKELQGVPSASGIRFFNGFIYVVGDDSSYLYRLNDDWIVDEAIVLYNIRRKPGEKIPKLIKADLEAMTIVQWQERLLLLTLGSGSVSPERDRGFLYLPDDKENKVFTFNLTPIYNYLRQNFDVAELNIEGAAADKEYLYIVHRGNLNEKNWLFKYDLQDFIAFGFGQLDTPPVPIADVFHFPQVGGVKPGYSDLEILSDGLLTFTLTLEDTHNSFDDGEVTGSLLGVLKQQPDGHYITETCAVTMDSKPWVEKIEGLALKERISDNEFILLAVSDNDAEPSGIMEVRLVI